MKYMNMLKKDSSWDILEHGIFDISEIKNELISTGLGNSFNNNIRNLEYKVHQYTESNVLYDFPLNWAGEDISSRVSLDHPGLIKLVTPIVQNLESFFDGKVGRVLLANLLSGKEIGKHKDAGYYLESVRRNHIPIITNKDVVFQVGEKALNMKPGHWYEINNNNTHYVKNGGDQDRYHLIIDILPKGVLNNGNIG